MIQFITQFAFSLSGKVPNSTHRSYTIAHDSGCLVHYIVGRPLLVQIREISENESFR